MLHGAPYSNCCTKDGQAKTMSEANSLLQRNLRGESTSRCDDGIAHLAQRDTLAEVNFQHAHKRVVVFERDEENSGGGPSVEEPLHECMVSYKKWGGSCSRESAAAVARVAYLGRSSCVFQRLMLFSGR